MLNKSSVPDVHFESLKVENAGFVSCYKTFKVKQVNTFYGHNSLSC